MSVSRLREECLPGGAANVCVRWYEGEELIGHVFASRWNYEGREVCWITQLCVRKKYRRQSIATHVSGSPQMGFAESDSSQLLRRLLKLSSEKVTFGILSSHPAAIMAFLRAFGGGIEVEAEDLEFTKKHAEAIMASSPIRYVRNAKVHGSLFRPGIKDGSVSCADTGFYVDHAEPLAVLNKLEEKRVMWPYGELPEGHEFLVLIEGMKPKDK